MTTYSINGTDSGAWGAFRDSISNKSRYYQVYYLDIATVEIREQTQPDKAVSYVVVLSLDIIEIMPHEMHTILLCLCAVVRWAVLRAVCFT